MLLRRRAAGKIVVSSEDMVLVKRLWLNRNRVAISMYTFNNIWTTFVKFIYFHEEKFQPHSSVTACVDQGPMLNGTRK